MDRGSLCPLEMPQRRCRRQNASAHITHPVHPHTYSCICTLHSRTRRDCSISHTSSITAQMRLILFETTSACQAQMSSLRMTRTECAIDLAIRFSSCRHTVVPSSCWGKRLGVVICLGAIFAAWCDGSAGLTPPGIHQLLPSWIYCSVGVLYLLGGGEIVPSLWARCRGVSQLA